MSYAEELLLEGRNEGRKEGRKEGEEIGEIKGQIKTIEGFLRAGITWATIFEATGVDKSGFEKLKERLAELTEDSDSSTSNA